MRCPQCDASFDEGTGELLGHLTFLQDRITCWRSDGAVQPATADLLAELTAREIAALAEAARPEPVLAIAAALIEADIPGASGAALTAPPPPLRGANIGYADPLCGRGEPHRKPFSSLVAPCSGMTATVGMTSVGRAYRSTVG